LGDTSFAAIEFLWFMTQLANPICLITCFRLDAALLPRSASPSQATRTTAQEGQSATYRGFYSKFLHFPKRQLSVNIAKRLDKPIT
jgi:hypothetical protein